MAAKLPPHLMNPPRRALKDLGVGESGYILRSYMAVSLSGDCFLDPRADLKRRDHGMIQVIRREDGYS